MLDTLYRALLRKLGSRRTITEYMRQWQHNEPLVWLLLAAALGGVLGWTHNLSSLLWCGLGLVVGLVAGHLFWGIPYHRNKDR